MIVHVYPNSYRGPALPEPPACKLGRDRPKVWRKCDWLSFFPTCMPKVRAILSQLACQKFGRSYPNLHAKSSGDLIPTCMPGVRGAQVPDAQVPDYIYLITTPIRLFIIYGFKQV